jgi:hypothetical protein
MRNQTNGVTKMRLQLIAAAAAAILTLAVALPARAAVISAVPSAQGLSTFVLAAAKKKPAAKKKQKEEYMRAVPM